MTGNKLGVLSLADIIDIFSNCAVQVGIYLSFSLLAHSLVHKWDMIVLMLVNLGKCHDWEQNKNKKYKLMIRGK
jgi:hypothetical protein